MPVESVHERVNDGSFGGGRADKLLHTMVMLKLGMVRKKVLLFVNSINAGYRLKLFLEAFGIRSAVINAELPLNSRHHILQVAGIDGFFQTFVM